MKPKAQATKENNNNLGFIKIENFCATSDVIRKVKRQLTEWKKIFANHVSDETYSEYIKNSYKSIIKGQITQFFFKGQSVWIDIFPKRLYKWPKHTGKGSQCH